MRKGKKKIKSPYLVLLSAPHHVEEEIYVALVDDGHALKESYLICGGEGEREGLDKLLLLKERI